MIAYVSGTKRATGSTSNAIHSLRRVSRAQVDQMSRGSGGSSSKRRGGGSRSTSFTGNHNSPRLNDSERAEMERAARKGFVTILKGRNRRGCPLATIHRQWCDARGKPQLSVYKATGGSRPLDQVFVDLSPLRLYGLFDDAIQVEDYIVRWKAEILTAACTHDMQLCGNMQDDDDEECDVDGIVDPMESVTLAVTPTTRQEWATQPIGKLLTLALVFEGERSSAKAMARDLAALWDIPEKIESGSIHRKGGARDKRKGGGKNKMKGLRQYRKRGGGHRQAWG